MLVAVASSKTEMVNVRLTPEVHRNFKIACELRGVSMSSLMHQFVIRTIREERELDPKAFTRHESPVLNDVYSVGEKPNTTILSRKEEVATKKKRTG